MQDTTSTLGDCEAKCDELGAALCDAYQWHAASDYCAVWSQSLTAAEAGSGFSRIDGGGGETVGGSGGKDVAVVKTDGNVCYVRREVYRARGTFTKVKADWAKLMDHPDHMKENCPATHWTGIPCTHNTNPAGDWLFNFKGGFAHGGYAYFSPRRRFSAYHTVVRVDATNFPPPPPVSTAAEFNGTTVLDVKKRLGNCDTCKGFSGAFTDGTYGYLVPENTQGSNHGNAVRFLLSNYCDNTQRTQASPPSCASLTDPTFENVDLGAINANMVGFTAGFTDGTYGYYTPNSATIMARIDLSDWTASGVTQLDLTGYLKEADGTTNFPASNPGATAGFQGKGFALGGYGYVRGLPRRLPHS